MNHEDKKQFSPALTGHIAAMNLIEADQNDVQAAQHKLDAAIAAMPPRRKSTARRWFFAATAASAIVIVSMLPLFGDSSGVAFAQVQKHFLDFQTMTFTVEQRFSGELTQSTLVQMNKAGDVRTDVDAGISVVVSPSQGQVLTLMHETREAMQFPIAKAAAEKNEAVDFLHEIQEYKKVAKPIKASKVIGGKTANGWELEIVGMHTEIWADQAGVPMLMTMRTNANGGTMDMVFHFAFNQDLPADTFSTNIPASYTRVRPDE